MPVGQFNVVNHLKDVLIFVTLLARYFNCLFCFVH